MKKIILLILLAAPFVLAAQNFEFLSLDGESRTDSTIVINSHVDSTLIEVPLLVKNTSNKPREAKIKKYEVSIVDGSEAYFCWDNCYPPTVFESSGKISINGGETTTSFSGDFKPKSLAGESIIKYTVYNVIDENDSASVTLKYIISETTGFDDLFTQDISQISKPYPNPASTYVMFDYQISGYNDGRLILYNIIGEKVRDLPLSSTSNQTRISLDNLPSGLYIYSFRIHNKTIQDGKILIK